MRIAVVGAGVGGLAAAVRLAHAGHSVTVLERSGAPGGKAGRLERDGFVWDTGPSLLTMPWVLRGLFAETGAPLDEELELVRVEPVTRYRFADGTGFDLSADLPRALDALEAWSPGAGADWTRVLGACASMWRASERFLGGPPPWPPRRPAGGWAGERVPDPRDLLAVRPWRTLRGLARATVRDPRLRMVVERFATYAGADPRRAPAALAVAGYVEHAFGAWHVRGGIHEIPLALARRLESLGGELQLSTPVRALREVDARLRGVETDEGYVACDAVVWNGPARDVLGGSGEPSLSGLALMLGLRGRDPERVHHEIRFPADYDAEFDDVFVQRRPVRDPTLYLAASWVSDPAEGPADGESLFVLANAPAGAHADWAAEEARIVERLGLGDRVVTSARLTPAELGPIYGDAPHGRLGALRRPNPFPRSPRGLYLVGGTTHPGGGLPLVMLGARTLAREIGPA